MPLLEVQDFTKRFTIHHLGREIAVFQDVQFALHEGQFMIIVGPNGAGKSTLLPCARFKAFAFRRTALAR